MRGYLEDLKAGGRPMRDKELAEHYKHLCRLVKKQKDDVVEYVKTTKLIDYDNDEVDMLKDTYVGEDLLRMLGEIDE